MANKSSRKWLKEHFSDPYVKKAQQAGYRSRAVFKLLEIQEKDHLFKPGMTVIDLGAAPGGWSQVVVKLIQPQGKVFALDLLPMQPISGVSFFQGDFTEQAILDKLLTEINEVKVDWVISDMAPNTSGNESIDVPRSLYLAELALEFSLSILKSEGGFLVKVFQGEGFDAFLSTIKRNFKQVNIRKPKASKSRSREIYIVGKKLKTV
jgi:23S rRNA (uridine2552-2'-O)-methyltransferase